MRRISKKILLKRIASMPSGLTLPKVAAHLGLSDKTLRRWVKDKKFTKAGGATRWHGRWTFDKEKLSLWAIAVLKLTTPKGDLEIRDNPPRDTAREVFGIGEGYRVQQ